MRLRFSEIRLLLSLLVFIVALIFMFYDVFFNPHSKTKMLYIIISLVLGRLSVILFRSARQKID